MVKKELVPRQLLFKFLCRAKPTLQRILSARRFRHDSVLTGLYFMCLPAQSGALFVDSVK